MGFGEVGWRMLGEIRMMVFSALWIRSHCALNMMGGMHLLNVSLLHFHRRAPPTYFLYLPSTRTSIARVYIPAVPVLSEVLSAHKSRSSR